MILNIKDYCTSGTFAVYLQAFKRFMNIIHILVPIILIVALTIQLFKALSSWDEAKLAKKKKGMINSVIAVVVIFFLPTLLDVVMGVINDVKGEGISFSSCWDYVDNLSTFRYANYIENSTYEKKPMIVDPNKYENPDTPPAKTPSGGGTNPSKNSTSSSFVYALNRPDTSYHGHTVSFSSSQYLKVLRSVYGEQEGANYEMFVGLSQYVRDYVDYGSAFRSYDNLGSRWLVRGGNTTAVPAYKNVQWFQQNVPELIRAVDYVFKEGGSLAQGKVHYYYDDDDAALDGGRENANNWLMKVSCGGGHNHEYVETKVNSSEWSVFAFGTG